MRIFVSWSGGPSQKIALLFKEWIPNVIQDAEVYVSAQDISKGERWLSNVNHHLSDHNFGISVITEENHLAPWILYEAGALAKSLDGRLVPVLCGITTIDMPNHPLSQFQWTVAPALDEMMKLMASINGGKEAPLPEDRLKMAVQMWHPRFEAAYNLIDLGADASVQRAPQADTPTTAALLELAKDIRDIKASLASLDLPPPTPQFNRGGLIALGRSMASRAPDTVKSRQDLGEIILRQMQDDEDRKRDLDI